MNQPNNCDNDSMNSDSIPPMYSDILFSHTINVIPGSDNLNSDHDDEGIECALQGQIVNQHETCVPEHSEMICSMKSESFYTCVTNYDSADLSNHKETNIAEEPDILLRSFSREMLRSRKLDSFETSIVSYDSADLLSIDDTCEDLSVLAEHSVRGTTRDKADFSKNKPARIPQFICHSSVINET